MRDLSALMVAFRARYEWLVPSGKDQTRVSSTTGMTRFVLRS
jgi:hypothetical protein